MARTYWRRLVARLALLIVAVLAWARPLEVHVGRRRYLLARDGRMVPVMAGGAPDEDEDDGADDEAEGDGETADESDDGGNEDDSAGGDEDGTGGDDAEDGEGEEGRARTPDWRTERQHARRHEREAKKARKEAADLRAKLERFEAQNKSAQEKALDEARRAAADEVRGEYETRLRETRLENAVTRLASKGVKVDDGDGGERTVRYADPEDAFAFLERAIAKGEIDGDDIYDEDGKVQADEVAAALAELLERKPHLAAAQASADPPAKRRSGSADAGKGNGSGKRTLEDMSPDEHLAAIRGGK